MNRVHLRFTRLSTLALDDKHAIPGLAWLAYYKDPESNIFGIYQLDKNAK